MAAAFLLCLLLSAAAAELAEGGAPAQCGAGVDVDDGSAMLQLRTDVTEALTKDTLTKDTAPPDSALIVVDMQNDFINGSLTVTNATTIIPTINSLAKLTGWSVIIYTMDYHPNNHMSFSVNSPFHKKDFDYVPVKYDKQSRICGKEYKSLYGESCTICAEDDVAANFSQQLWPKHCVQGTWGQEMDSRIFMAKGSSIVNKGITSVVDSYGAFENNFGEPENGIETELRMKDVKNVYVTGVALDYCVKNTAKQSRKRGFTTKLVTDATMPVDGYQGLKAKEELEAMNVELIPSSTLLS